MRLKDLPPARLVDQTPGVDYMVDYFAVLGVERTADGPEIEKAYLNMMRLYHPDLYSQLAPEFQRVAAEKSLIINESYAKLGTDADRQAYRELLEKWQGPISTNGKPRVALARINAVPNLLADRAAGSLLEIIEDSAQILSGFNADTFAYIEGEYKKTKHPSLELEKAYRSMLAKKDVQLGLKQSTLLDFIGLNGDIARRPVQPVNHAALLQEAVRVGREVVASDAANTLLQLFSGEMQLLGSGVDVTQEIANDPTSALTVYREQILERYDRQAADITRLAEERQLVILERLELVRGYLLPGQVPTDHLLVKYQMGEHSLWQSFRLASKTHIEGEEISWQSEDLEGMDTPQLVEWGNVAGYTVMMVMHEEGLPARELLEKAVIEYYNSLERSHRQKRKRA